MNNETRISKTRTAGQIYGNGMLNAEPDARLHLGDKTFPKKNLRRHHGSVCFYSQTADW